MLRKRPTASASGRALRHLASLTLLTILSIGTASIAASPAADGLRDLEGIGELQERFNRDRGSVRLVLLLSPT